VHTQKNLQSTASSLALKAWNAIGTLETGEGNAAECASHKTSRQSWADSARNKELKKELNWQALTSLSFS